jgi:hypothetical protein
LKCHIKHPGISNAALKLLENSSIPLHMHLYLRIAPA